MDKYGNRLEYDPKWRGPLKGRSCTDVLCLLIFLVFMGCWVGVAYYALNYGDISRLLVPTDSEGRKCGVDSEVVDKPYLVFFDLTTCATVSTTCDTPQVCVSECPTSNFVYILNASLIVSDEELKAKMICKIDVNLDAANRSVLDSYVENNWCASWYLASVSMTKRCIPSSIPSELANYTITAEQLETAMEVIEILAYFQTTIEAAYNDFLTTRIPVLMLLLGSAVFCLIYITIMRWLATPITYVSSIGVCVLLTWTTYRSYLLYSSTASNWWLAITIVLGIILAILLFVLICLRKRIRLACQLIKEASKAVTSILSSLIFPIVPWILQMATIAVGIAIALYLTSIGNQNYQVEFTGDSCVCPEELGYTNGSTCTPSVFSASCTEDNGTCTSGGCHLMSTDSPWFAIYLHIVNVVAFLWLFFFISALGEMILAGTFATWYWTFSKYDVPFFTMSVSIWRTLRYHLGTLAFGSLIITICRLIRAVLEYIDVKLKQSENDVTKALLKCLKCCFWLLEKFLIFLNRNAYIMCAIHGKSFCYSARDAFSLLMRNVVRVVVLNKLTEWLLFLGKVLVTGGAMWVTWWIYVSSVEVTYWLVPTILVGIGTYLVASVFFAVHTAAVDTLFLCFLEDCERNDGTPQKPYYMSRGLMKLFKRS